jgi:hypothetical protein
MSLTTFRLFTVLTVLAAVFSALALAMLGSG